MALTWLFSSFDSFPSSITGSPVWSEVYEIGAGGESSHPHLLWLQAPAQVILSDVGDITAHQSSFNKSPFDTGHTMRSL